MRGTKESDLPFLIVSGTISEELAVTAMKNGAQDYIRKGNLTRLVPAIERELREAVERHERKRAEEQLRATQEQFRVRSHAPKTARGILVVLYRAVQDFSQNQPQLDDLTFVVVKVKPAS